MLRLVGGSVIGENVESLAYDPGLQDSGDLEAATSNITATSKPGAPDYVASLAVPAPPDSRLVVQRLALRLAVTLDSLNNGATQLNFSVHVNGVERLIGNWGGTGTQVAAVDLIAGQFDLQEAHTVDVYLWVDAGDAVVSSCELRMGVGSVDISEPSVQPALTITHRGLAQVTFAIRRAGTGTPRATMSPVDSIGLAFYGSWTGDWTRAERLALMDNAVISMNGTVATDINVIEWLRVFLSVPR